MFSEPLRLIRCEAIASLPSMPSDEYASASGGALRLKGAKVEKHKHKHKHKKSKDDSRDKRAKHAEEELARGEATGSASEGRKKNKAKKEGDDDDPYARMTEAERRFLEAQDKKVCLFSPAGCPLLGPTDVQIRDLMHVSPEEARVAHPELFKSHKERLADLNTYLSRMSEHHDMPKIGPG